MYHWHYVLPFSGLSFYFVNGFLFCANTFQFDVVPFVYFFLSFPCLRGYIKKILLREMLEILLPVFSSRIFMGFFKKILFIYL